MISMTWPQHRRRECTIDGRTAKFAGGQFRLVVCLLLADPRRYLEANDLVEELWPFADTSPEDAVGRVQQVIHALRRMGVPIESRSKQGASHQGYRIPRWERGRNPEAAAA